MMRFLLRGISRLLLFEEIAAAWASVCKSFELVELGAVASMRL